jgi:hypothetical protein
MLSHFDRRGLNRWCVWRKGLASLHFDQLEDWLGRTGLDRPHRRKASAVERSHSESLEPAKCSGVP